ncbi:MAG TPA: hypothetical protein VM753_10870, partial [Anaeromyxobacter sp.]|nr:hypothetical protein [Anaeromyxobacter sp.]
MQISALSIALVALIAAAGCAGSGDARPSPRACSTDDECGAGWCVRSACVANSAPKAQIVAPTTLRAS